MQSELELELKLAEVKTCVTECVIRLEQASTVRVAAVGVFAVEVEIVVVAAADALAAAGVLVVAVNRPCYFVHLVK